MDRDSSSERSPAIHPSAISVIRLAWSPPLVRVLGSVVLWGVPMISRNFVLGSCAVALLGTHVWAKPAVPDPETPPVTLLFASTYYTNIAASSATLATLRGLKRADEVYSPALSLNLVEPMGGMSLFVAGQAGYDFHQRNSILDRERINLQAGADAQLNVCDTTLSGSYARYQSDLVDLSVVTTKNTQELLSGELDVACNQSGRIVPSASFSDTGSDNTAVLYKRSDYRTTAISGNVLYKAGSLGSFSLIGQYAQTTYPHRTLLIGAGSQSDGYDLYSGGIHYERNIGSDLGFEASVSQTWLSNKGIANNFSGITYDATLTYHATPRLNFDLSASRQTLPSNYLNAAYSIAESYSAGADYRVSARLTAKIGASQTHSNYGGAALVAGTDLTAQTYRSFYGTLAYALSPTFSVSLTGGQEQRHANVIGYSYSGAHIGLSLSKAF
jgi:Putative beta-barrel porin 2